MIPARGPQTVSECNMFYATFFYAIFAMQYVLCNLCYAIFVMQYLLCNLCYCAIFGIQSLQCNLCYAIFAMQYLLCNLCYGIFAMQSLLCNLCYAIFAMQSLLFAEHIEKPFVFFGCCIQSAQKKYVAENVEKPLVFLVFLHSDCKTHYKTGGFCNILLKLLKNHWFSFVFCIQIAKNNTKPVLFAIFC